MFCLCTALDSYFGGANMLWPLRSSSLSRTAILGILTVAWASAACAADRSTASRPGDSARQILAATGFTGGLIVHLGCGDGRLTAALGANDSCLVQGLDANPEKVQRARQYIRSLGTYGSVSVDRFDGKRLPYADNLVNLIVAEDLGQVTMDELMRALCPGGVVCVKQDGDVAEDGQAVAEGNRPVDALPARCQRQRGGQGLAGRAAAPFAMDGRAALAPQPRVFAEHFRDGLGGRAGVLHHGRRHPRHLPAGAAGALGGDRPRRLQRRAALAAALFRLGAGASGTTRKHWSTPVSQPRRLVAVGDRVYVTLGYRAPVSVLDAKTGQLLRVLEQTANTEEIVCGRRHPAGAPAQGDSQLSAAGPRPGTCRCVGRARRSRRSGPSCPPRPAARRSPPSGPRRAKCSGDGPSSGSSRFRWPRWAGGSAITTSTRSSASTSAAASSFGERPARPGRS